jgi:hypothetical protein
MGLTAKILPTNDLLAWTVLEAEKAPAGAGAFLYLSFNCTGLTVTKNHFWESFILLMGFGLLVFWCVWGLDMPFC